jgi:hypothetical protein
MQLEFPHMGLPHLMTLVLGRAPLRQPAFRAKPERPPVPETEDDRADRAFLLEVMSNHPEAVQSETGMMLLMAQYPRYL